MLAWWVTPRAPKHLFLDILKHVMRNVNISSLR